MWEECVRLFCCTASVFEKQAHSDKVVGLNLWSELMLKIIGCDAVLLSSEAEDVDPVCAVVCWHHLLDRLFSLLLLLLNLLLEKLN